jgi:NodT family efflux transporter outer membrane factor (OMF) lipoprotein
MSKSIQYIVVFLFLGAAVVSCRVTKTYQPPGVQHMDSFRGSGTADTITIGNLPWRQVFTDTILQRIIEQGIAQNLNLQMAYTRIRQAQAYYKQSRAAFLPEIDANAGVGRVRLSKAENYGIVSSVTEYQVGVSAAWEVDIWGQLKSAKKANLAGLLSTEAGVRAIQSEIVSEIASLYYTLMALDEQLSITEQTVRNWDTTVITMQSLQASARVTEAAVVQSVAQREAVTVTIPDIDQSILQTENALSILLGMPPTAISRSRLEDEFAMAMLNTGVPAQLLANRPDVQQAEQDFRAAFELTNVARTAFYPTLTITGGANYTSFALSNLFDVSSLGASVLGGLTQPIFNRRLNKTKLEVAKEQQQAALLSFKNTLLIAGQEVSDALSLHAAAMAKAGVRGNEITALQQSVDYTQELLQNGFANYTEVITARQTLLEAQLGRVNDKLQELQSTVSLYTALGGGWR